VTRDQQVRASFSKYHYRKFWLFRIFKIVQAVNKWKQIYKKCT